MIATSAHHKIERKRKRGTLERRHLTSMSLYLRSRCKRPWVRAFGNVGGRLGFVMSRLGPLLGSVPTGTGTIAFGPTFGSFTLWKLGFTLSEPVSLVKVFRLLKLEQIFSGVQSVDTVGSCTRSYFIGRASVFVMPCF
jgi:hypothetical protein